MDFGLKNKVAFIGASSDGLGKAVAMELANEGATVIINGRNKEKLESTKAEFDKKLQTNILSIPGDLSDLMEREHVIKTVFNNHDHIDILITNTGGPPSGKFEDFKLEDWNKTYELLLASTVSLIQSFLPGMKQEKWGRIITITSQAVKQPVNNLVLSNSVRASVVGLVKTLSNELGEHNITVNNVMPGYSKTNRLNSLLDKNPSFHSAIDEIPLNRFAEPEEFAAAVTFLASARASYITGVSLAVDGGWIKNIM
jgi:3-oxoacyl-[acyl-carrier protein] reductase